MSALLQHDCCILYQKMIDWLTANGCKAKGSLGSTQDHLKLLYIERLTA